MENEKLNKMSNDIKQKQVAAIKDIIRLTFEQLQELEKSRNVLQDQIKLLKLDLIDYKEGRLDRIRERQNLAEESKRTSVAQVSRSQSEQREGNPWYINYDITFEVDGIASSIQLNNSITKMHAAGSYKLKDGSIRYL